MVGTAVAFDYPDMNARGFVLAERDDGEGRWLQIQRAVEPLKDDAMYGQDTYSLLDESAATHYGGVVRWSVTGDIVRILLDAGAAATFQTDEFLLRLKDETKQASMVREALSDLLGSPPR